MITYAASYDPADNRLRLRASARLDADTYARVKALGFAWAPKQDLFVAPAWSPQREDLLLELCEEIGDEDTTLVERAEQRADRFENYSDKREVEAHRAKEHVAQIADGIPFGQPILVGHHSEKRARKDADRIESGMRKAVKLWETSQYWERRAARALAHAKYKELPGVRVRRIRKLEAEKRVKERELAKCEEQQRLWSTNPLTFELAMRIANDSYHSLCFPLSEYPRDASKSLYEGKMSIWSALGGGIATPEQVRERVLPGLAAVIAWDKRWITHYTMRLIYERCMLEESGHVEEPKNKSAKQTLPLCNYRAETIKSPSRYHRGQIDEFPQVEMTKAQYAKVYKDYKGTRIVDNSHKVRIALVKSHYVGVFLTDSKVHPKPGAIAPQEPPAPRMPRAVRPAPERSEFDDIKDSLKAGVKVVNAPQLFPTPPEIASRMVALADISVGESVLEPSAGTGRILDAVDQAIGLRERLVVAVEIDAQLVQGLHQRFNREWAKVELHQADFLTLAATDPTRFDVVLLNPPFRAGSDIAHIMAAMKMTRSGGRVVAICANGPRQNDTLKPMAQTWEELPEGTFANAGTNVSTVIASFVVK